MLLDITIATIRDNARDTQCVQAYNAPHNSRNSRSGRVDDSLQTVFSEINRTLLIYLSAREFIDYITRIIVEDLDGFATGKRVPARILFTLVPT